MAHSTEPFLGEHGTRVFKELEKLKVNGLTDRIGVSAYDIDEVLRIANLFPIDVVQLPYNILAHDDVTDVTFKKLRSRNVEVHVRSIFLQGLLFMHPDKLPRKFRSFRPFIYEIRKFSERFGVSMAQYLFYFVKQNPLIDKIVIGLTNADQLLELIGSDVNIDYSSLKSLTFTQKHLLDPRNW